MQTDLPPVLSLRQVSELTRIGRDSIVAWSHDEAHSFPRPIPRGTGKRQGCAYRWLRSQVLAWLDGKGGKEVAADAAAAS
jgi:predicted DNA-binding transcriptional regulator AlpA